MDSKNIDSQYLIFLDTETNGLDSISNVPLNIALFIYNATTGAIGEVYNAMIKCTYEEFKSSDPEALKVNGITWESVKDGKSIGDIKSDIMKIFSENKITCSNSRFICQNPSFDKGFFNKIIDPKTQ